MLNIDLAVYIYLFIVVCVAKSKSVHSEKYKIPRMRVQFRILATDGILFSTGKSQIEICRGESTAACCYVAEAWSW